MNLAQTDPQIAELIQLENHRQESTLELIASENHVSPAVMAAAGSALTNKYAEGYPGQALLRRVPVCTIMVENFASDRAKQLFGCESANVQPHSGATGQPGRLHGRLMQPGDTIIALNLATAGTSPTAEPSTCPASGSRPSITSSTPRPSGSTMAEVRAKRPGTTSPR